MSQTIVKSVKDLVAEANAKIQTMSLAEAEGLLSSSKHVFVDLRDIRELQKTGKFQMRFLILGMLEFWIDPQSPYHKEIFIIDKPTYLVVHSAWRSALSTLQPKRRDQLVRHSEGGFSAWQKAGLPIEEMPKR